MVAQIVDAGVSEPNIRIGIGGWTYEPWRGTFYPNDLPQKRELEYAASKLTAIEINATFYSRQSPKSWENWGNTVPNDFQFCIKGSRYIVTRPKLADAGEGIGNFLAQGLTALGEKLGPILWMLAARRKFDREDIAAFLKLLPAKHEGVALRHVIEPRHDSFRDEAFFALCRDHKVAIAYGDDDEFPLIDADTADFRYARLQRMHEDVPTGYDAESLDDFARLIQDWGKDSYIFMINGAKERALRFVWKSADGTQWTMPAGEQGALKAIETLPDGALLVLERQGTGKAVTAVLRRIGTGPCGARGCTAGDAVRLPGLAPGDNFEGLARIAPNLFVMVSDDGGDRSRPTRLVLFRFSGD